VVCKILSALVGGSPLIPWERAREGPEPRSPFAASPASRVGRRQVVDALTVVVRVVVAGKQGGALRSSSTARSRVASLRCWRCWGWHRRGFVKWLHR
jgi:hypothetical protein